MFAFYVFRLNFAVRIFGKGDLNDFQCQAFDKRFELIENLNY